MEFAFGVLHWTPDDFWRSTMKEIIRAAEGVRLSNTMPENDKMDMDTFLDLSSKHPDANTH